MENRKNSDLIKLNLRNGWSEQLMEEIEYNIEFQKYIIETNNGYDYKMLKSAKYFLNRDIRIEDILIKYTDNENNITKISQRDLVSAFWILLENSVMHDI